MEFTKILEYIIKSSGLNQSEFAKKVGVKPGQVSEWLHGKSKPGYDSLRAICLGLNVAPEVLLGIADI